MIESIVFIVITAYLGSVHPIGDPRTASFITWKTHKLVFPLFVSSAVLAFLAFAFLFVSVIRKREVRQR